MYNKGKNNCQFFIYGPQYTKMRIFGYLGGPGWPINNWTGPILLPSYPLTYTNLHIQYGSNPRTMQCLRTRSADAVCGRGLRTRSADAVCGRGLRTRSADAVCGRGLRTRSADAVCGRGLRTRSADAVCGRGLRTRSADAVCGVTTTKPFVHSYGGYNKVKYGAKWYIGAK